MNYIVPINISLVLLSCTLTFLINPGIIYSNKKSKEKIYCSDCKFLYPASNKKMEHCYICNICVCKMDHHCDVIGKCVGKYNTALFLLYVISSFAFMFGFSAILFNLLRL